MSTVHQLLDQAETHPHHDNCIFCRIGSGEIPSHVVYEDDQLKAFLDIQPIRTGHVLIVPKAHYDYYESLPAQLAAAIVI